MKSKFIVFAICLILTIAPMVVFAQTTTCNTSTLPTNPKLQDVVCYIVFIINRSIIPLIFAIAIALFVWGVVQYVINADSEEKRKKGKQFMIWGIIALTVMLSVWGLVKIVGGTFGLNTSVLPQATPR